LRSLNALVFAAIAGNNSGRRAGKRALSETMTSKSTSQQQQQHRDAQVINLDYLTDAERQLIIAVLDRDADVRQKEQTRIKLVFLELMTISKTCIDEF